MNNETMAIEVLESLRNSLLTNEIFYLNIHEIDYSDVKNPLINYTCISNMNLDEGTMKKMPIFADDLASYEVLNIRKLAIDKLAEITNNIKKGFKITNIEFIFDIRGIIGQSENKKPVFSYSCLTGERLPMPTNNIDLNEFMQGYLESNKEDLNSPVESLYIKTSARKYQVAQLKEVIDSIIQTK